jgi:hypothetical protein
MAWAMSDLADTRASKPSNHARKSSSSGPARAWRCALRTSGPWPLICSSIA